MLEIKNTELKQSEEKVRTANLELCTKMREMIKELDQEKQEAAQRSGTEERYKIICNVLIWMIININVYVSMCLPAEMSAFISSTGTTWWTGSEPSSCWNMTLRWSSWRLSTSSSSNSYSESTHSTVVI